MVDISVFILKNIMGRNRIYNLNENYFNSIDSGDKAYILGFIYADGSINKNYLSIGLSDKDIEILEYFKKCLGYNGKIYKRVSDKGLGYGTLTISSKILTNKLIDFGIIGNKTYLSKTLPKYPKEYEKDFLRGFFDGDGSIYCNKLGKDFTVNFSGNLNILSEIKNILSDYNISSCNIRHRHETNESCLLDIKGNLNIEKIYLLFYNTESFYLKRKKEKFNDFNKMLDNLNKRNINKTIIEDILVLYLSGVKQIEIAKIKNMPSSSIRSIIQRLRKNGKIK